MAVGAVLPRPPPAAEPLRFEDGMSVITQHGGVEEADVGVLRPRTQVIYRVVLVSGDPGVVAGPPVADPEGLRVGARQLVDRHDGLVQPGGLAAVVVVELELQVVYDTTVVLDADQELVPDLVFGEASGQQLLAGVRLTRGEVRVERRAVDALDVERGHDGLLLFFRRISLVCYHT